MTGKERLSWLKQIKRIHENQDKKRELELSEQFSILKENNQWNDLVEIIVKFNIKNKIFHILW